MKGLMKIKHLFPIFACALLLSACGAKKTTTTPTDASTGTKLLVNELPMAQRPFVVLVPHSTNRLLPLSLLTPTKPKLPLWIWNILPVIFSKVPEPLLSHPSPTPTLRPLFSAAVLPAENVLSTKTSNREP